MSVTAAEPAREPEREPSGLELVGKAGAVIDALQGHGELNAAELAVECGEPLSSLYRLLRSLLGIGWIDKGHRRGSYRLGLTLLSVGVRLEESLDLREAALPSLRGLLAATGATSFLCVRRGNRAVCVERLEGAAVRSLAMQLGASLPLYAGAAPRALLSFLPEDEQQVVLADRSQQAGDPVRPAETAIRADIRLSRREGVTRSDQDVTPGIAALGAPVFDHRDTLVAAISISGLRSAILGAGVDRNIALLLEAAAEVERALGRFDDQTMPTTSAPSQRARA